MNTRIVYFDETGDDGLVKYSCDHFVLTSIYMPTDSWQANHDMMASLRHSFRADYGFKFSQEMHTKYFLTNKNPYESYGWSKETRLEILNRYLSCICSMDFESINVIIDKTTVHSADYPILKNALTYNLQRIDNASKSDWNYIAITDSGRLASMRKTAREIRKFNPVQSMYGFDYRNIPIQNMIEDMMEKDSSESYFIQICDFISYFVHLYFDVNHNHRSLPGRVGNLLSPSSPEYILTKLKEAGRLNLKANRSDPFGLVIYPK